MLGTNITTSLIEELHRYKNVIVALDRDATGKALDLRNRLCYYIGSNVRVKMLDEDIKVLNLKQLKDLFHDCC